MKNIPEIPFNPTKLCRVPRLLMSLVSKAHLEYRAEADPYDRRLG